jgi:homoprotocatechuate degradation regulator HpaR
MRVAGENADRHPEAAAKRPSKGDGSKKSMRPFRRSLPMQLMRAREAVMAHFRPHLAAHGLTEQQWRVIRALEESREFDIAALAEHCCLHAASLSRILPNLESEGLVVRRTSKTDQRRMMISLAPRGHRLFAEIAPQSEAIYAALAEAIGPQRIEAAYRVLDELIFALSGAKPARRAAARSRSDALKTARKARPPVA